MIRLYYLLYMGILLVLFSCKAETTPSHNSLQHTMQSEVPMVSETKTPNSDQYLFIDTIIGHDQVAHHVRIFQSGNNRGTYITILPSLGRGVEDYTEQYNCSITTRLVEAGYVVVLIQPRGIGQSTGDLTPQHISLDVLSMDIKTVLDALDIDKIHIVGHAFGNRLGRNFASLYPNYVDKVILLASGGNFKITSEAEKCLRGSIDMSLDDEERLKMIDCAFFAEGNDARIWLNGWYPKLAQAQIYAALNAQADFYKKAGGRPILLVQATEDLIAPPDLAGKALAEALGPQVTYVEVEHAGHALTSEQPDEVARLMINYLKTQ